MTARAGKLVFVGDVHIERDDPDLAAFLAFLEGLPAIASRVVLMGDLFNLWLGERSLEQPHHRAVFERLRGLRAAGLPVRYLEGNRDYRIAGQYAGDVVDDSTDAAIVERFGDRSIVAVHGDLANRADRQYRLWRRISRSSLAWRLFHLVPGPRRARFADSLEGRMRATNVAFKRAFPEQAIRDYAAGFFREGHDTLVLGHFHVERDLAADAGRILVLPAWKDSRRHLEVDPDGTIRFAGA